MLDLIFDLIGDVLLEAFCAVFAAMFSGLFGMREMRGGPEMLTIVPHLPNGAGVLLAKGGN